MPSLVATTYALARKPCVSTHYVRTNNAKFSGHYICPRTQNVCAHALRSHQFLVLSYLYFNISSGCEIAGGFQVNWSQVVERLFSSSRCGGEVAPWIWDPFQANEETLRVTREDGREVPLSLWDTTKNLYIFPTSKLSILTSGTAVTLCLSLSNTSAPDSRLDTCL